jgi:NADH-quinone oxidoreductase E subunit
MLGATLRSEMAQLVARYPRKESALLPILDLVQRRSRDAIAPEDLQDIAAFLGVSAAWAYGVQTFYSMYHSQPLGKYHLQLDTNIPAMLAGAPQILAHLERTLGIKPGQTTPDGLFTLSEVEDLASCGTCPVMQVNDRYYENLTPEKVDALLASLRQGVMPNWKSESHWATECNVLLRRRGKANSAAIETYLADGGYEALDKALSIPPAAVVDEVKESFLRGLGGAGFPTGVKWSFLPRENTLPVYLVCNADEGEPGTFKDRQIMEFDPHLLLEGMAIAGYALGAKLGFIYIRGEFAWIADILEQAVLQARHHHKLGNNLCGRGVEFDVIVHRGAGAYICGEETALLESLEGKRGEPRLKPPFPVVRGLYGCPTMINNVETLASVPYIIGQGAAAYKKFGGNNNYGFRIFGVSGHVRRPGTYEFALGTPLEKILAAAGDVLGRLKAVIVGGLSSPLLTAAEAQGLKLDFDSCLQKGAMLGSGGIIVMNDTVSIPEIALRAIRFYRHESCGQCTPCREGTWVLEALLRNIVQGRAAWGDIDAVLRICAAVKGSTLCPIGDAFALPLAAMVRKFRGEFEALIKG